MGNTVVLHDREAKSLARVPNTSRHPPYELQRYAANEDIVSIQKQIPLVSTPNIPYSPVPRTAGNYRDFLFARLALFPTYVPTDTVRTNR